MDGLTLAEIVRLGKAWARLNGKSTETMSAEDFAAINEAYPVPMELNIAVDATA
jgi:hypothetical protein